MNLYVAVLSSVYHINSQSSDSIVIIDFLSDWTVACGCLQLHIHRLLNFYTTQFLPQYENVKMSMFLIEF